MADPPKNTRFSMEDYPDAPEWFQPFLENINKFVASTVLALDGNLTRGQNFKSQRKSLTFDTKATVGDTFPLSELAHNLNGLVQSVAIGGVTTLSSGDSLTNAVTLIWERTSENKVRIKYITGLNASKRYKVDFIIESD